MGVGVVVDVVRGALVLAAVAVIGVVVVTAVAAAARGRKGGVTMWKTLKQWWKYLAMKLHLIQVENTDLRVQLEQAIQESREQDRRLRDQAANVIANQKRAQARLDRALADYEHANALAEQALVLADQERRTGNEQKSAKFEVNAESLASKALVLERDIGELEQQLLQATRDADQARAAVEQNGATLQKTLREKEQLLDRLDRAKVQEEMNKALEQFSTTLGGDVPTLGEVADRIDRKLGRAEAHREIAESRLASTSDTAMVEVEQAQRSAEAQAWLAERRAKLGIVASPAAGGDGRVEMAD
jgi:phage shock protein A